MLKFNKLQQLKNLFDRMDDTLNYDGELQMRQVPFNPVETNLDKQPAFCGGQDSWRLHGMCPKRTDPPAARTSILQIWAILASDWGRQIRIMII